MAIIKLILNFAMSLYAYLRAICASYASQLTIRQIIRNTIKKYKYISFLLIYIISIVKQ